MGTELDPKSRITRGEVPDLTFSKQTVAESASDSISDDMKFIEDRVQKLYSMNDDENKLTSKIALNMVDEVSKALRRVEEYKILTERDLNKSTMKISEVQEVLREFLMTGKIKKPAKTEEQEVIEEVDDLINSL